MGEPVKKKKKSKKEKKKKSKKKSKKSKHRRHNSSSSDSEEEDRKKKRKKKHKKHHEESDVSESPALDTSRTSVEEEKEVEQKDEEEIDKPTSYCFCSKPETEDMIGCDFCDMWYHPECEDKKTSTKGRGRPKKQEVAKKSSSDDTLHEKTKKSAIKPSNPPRGKAASKKQTISKQYISDEDITDTDDVSSREESPNTKVRKGKTKQKQVAVKKNEKNSVENSPENELLKCQDVKKKSVMKKTPISMSDNLSDSNDDASSAEAEASTSIIRIPMEVSQLNHSDTS